MSASQIPYEKRLQILEMRLKGYQNNYQFAVDNNNPIRQTKYANSIRATKLDIDALEKSRPLESNERLRNIIKGLNEKNSELRTDIKGLEERVKELENWKFLVLNPPKKKPDPVAVDLQTNVPHECPDCGRTFKGARGVAAHQRSGACKKAT